MVPKSIISAAPVQCSRSKGLRDRVQQQTEGLEAEGVEVTTSDTDGCRLVMEGRQRVVPHSIQLHVNLGLNSRLLNCCPFNSASTPFLYSFDSIMLCKYMTSRTYSYFSTILMQTCYNKLLRLPLNLIQIFGYENTLARGYKLV